MKKRLLSAVLALVLCAYPAMAADFGTLTISSDREVIDDSVLYELAEADEPSTLTLRTDRPTNSPIRFCFPQTAKTPMVSPTPNGLCPIPTSGSTFLIR